MTTLLVASGGGHLKQLHRLLPRLGVHDDRVWVTFDTGLSRSLLADEEVFFAPYAHPHDLAGTARDALFAARLFRARRFDRVISTGANLAVAFLPLARASGAQSQYIETATRSDGFSVTGRLMARVPGVERYTQHVGLADRRWKYGGSVFEGFTADHRDELRPIRKVVVTLGSNESYGFDRLVHRLSAVLPSDVEVLWQLGRSKDAVAGGRDVVPAAELEQAMTEADVVVAHAGTGSALSALEVGKFPVLVVRRAQFGEHIDDHQELTASYLAQRNLALAAEADDLDLEDLRAAARWQVREAPDAPPFAF